MRPSGFGETGPPSRSNLRTLGPSDLRSRLRASRLRRTGPHLVASRKKSALLYPGVETFFGFVAPACGFRYLSDGMIVVEVNHGSCLLYTSDAADERSSVD